MNINELIANQKQFLKNYLEPKVAKFTSTIDTNDLSKLDELLFDFTKNNDFINVAYVLNPKCYQISANVTKRHIKSQFRGQDLSARPFLAKFSAENSCYLTDSYLSITTLKPCISLVYGIKQNDRPIAILVLDLDLIKLPMLAANFVSNEFNQIKGDIAIRSGIFNQVRKISKLDENINKVHKIVKELINNMGIFHIKIHYAASRVTIWQYQDPYKYLVLSLDELLNDNIYLLFPKQPYPQDAIIPSNEIDKILGNFKYLRFMDENMYLRAGSVNIMNGTIGVNFSCDGYHYIQADEFLANFSKLYA
jgi:hypothetical protein